MKIIDAKNTGELNKIHQVKTGVLYSTEHAMVVHITLQAGEQLKPHITPVDVFFYVLEGTPTIAIGEEKQAVAAEHLVESPANIKHCIYNETGQVARVLVVKAPRPTTETKVL
jgi:quercetin dioxygenase-like cupin family protein